MSTISIKDLPESVDLDRESMLAIVGGARLSGRQHLGARPQGGRIIDYPPGVASFTVPHIGGRQAGGEARK